MSDEFIYCPKCGTKLVETIYNGNKECPKCDWYEGDLEDEYETQKELEELMMDSVD